MIPLPTALLIAASLGLAAMLLYLYLLAPGRVRDGGEAIQRQGIEELTRWHYAHRGLHSVDRSVPENSLAAFVAARDGGYGMELDLNLTRDGQVVVFHDDTLERVCGVSGRVVDQTLAELRELRLHGTGERIPTLREVLEEISGSVPLIVELKDTPRHRELCRAAATILDGYSGPYCIESFHPAIVRWFRKHRPAVIRGQLSAGHREFPDQSPPVRFLLSSLLTNGATRPHFVAYRHQDARRAGGSVPRLRLRLFRALGGFLVTWTVTAEDDRKWCLEHFDTIIFEYFLP
ncbi:MAG: glycerophosphodiester phosphodiesterase [Spirochaetaceae bacterium]|nr:MAG: glycerophosphodiester phosphodiesterase [Spirochaetaceae bacterium]